MDNVSNESAVMVSAPEFIRVPAELGWVGRLDERLCSKPHAPLNRNDHLPIYTQRTQRPVEFAVCSLQSVCANSNATSSLEVVPNYLYLETRSVYCIYTWYDR